MSQVLKILLWYPNLLIFEAEKLLLSGCYLKWQVLGFALADQAFRLCQPSKLLDLLHKS